MTINLIVVGRIKEAPLRSLIFEYSKRIGKFCRLNINEIKDLACDKSLSDKEKIAVLESEGKLILDKINEREYVIALAIEGRTYTSEKFAQILDKSFELGMSKVAFIIGGSLGLSEEVKKRADLLLSFSPMTFPHQLMRLILLEQTYRAFKILNNEPYHK